MKKAKRIVAMATALVITLMMNPMSSKVMAAEAESNQIATKFTIKDNKLGLRLQDDFYEAINKDWLSTAKIEDGNVAASTGQEVYDMVTKQKRI